METQKLLEAFDTPMDVRLIEGEVVVLGPDRVAISLTVNAAEESGRRLLRIARSARGGPPNGR